MFSTNLFVDAGALRLESGDPKRFGKKTDAGNVIVSFFCGDCGTTLWRETTGIPVCVRRRGVTSFFFLYPWE